MSEQYLSEVSKHLTSLLAGLPKQEQASEMSECVAAANGYLNSNPRTESAEAFSLDLFNDPGMISLAEKDAGNRLAMSAETPNELVVNLMPSDGHLE